MAKLGPEWGQDQEDQGAGKHNDVEEETMIKVDQEPRTLIAGRAIGSGIQNVLFADVRTVEDAKESVAAVRAETPQTGGPHGSGDRRFAGYIQKMGARRTFRPWRTRWWPS